ncbi:MAG: glycosyl hydrolase 115 family protein [Lachnotalea sp.]
MNTYFELNRNVLVEYNDEKKPIEVAVKRFFRDLEMTLNETTRKGSKIILCKTQQEKSIGFYEIAFVNRETMRINTSDDLGVIYALLYLSETYLNIHPFWFWNDQKFDKKEYINIPMQEIISQDYRVNYRGWFVNDEVLICNWQGDVPFWTSDAKYDSDESRGELISSIIKYQYDLVCEAVKNPICCTNLYGEIMELYQKGHIRLPDDIIFIWADKWVRQDGFETSRESQPTY